MRQGYADMLGSQGGRSAVVTQSITGSGAVAIKRRALTERRRAVGHSQETLA